MNSAELQTRVLGAWMQKRRVFLRLTQADLAAKVGCATDLISKIERGNRRISKPLAPKLSAAFGLLDDEQTQFMRLVTASRSPVGIERLPRLPHAVGAAVTLPEPATPLIGRCPALAHCLDLFARLGVRLLTFTGPPGVGKSHLAVELARRLAQQFAEGARFISLAALPPGADILQALIDARLAQIPAGQASADLLAPLIQALAHQQLLLVLDNFEYLQTGPNILGISKLLAGCPKLKVIVTSRAALSLRAEYVYVVQPLAVPSNHAGQSPDPDALAQNPAVAMYAGRAQATDSGFALSADNCEAVRDLVIYSQGLPLALELLAARMHMLSVRELLALLSAHENPAAALLTFSAHRDGPEHQRTLAATIGRSINLLQPDERRLLAQLARCAGCFSLESVLAVDGTLGAFEALISQSLVQHVEPAAAGLSHCGNPDPGASRYFLLECVRLVALQDQSAKSF